MRIGRRARRNRKAPAPRRSARERCERKYQRQRELRDDEGDWDQSERAGRWIVKAVGKLLVLGSLFWAWCRRKRFRRLPCSWRPCGRACRGSPGESFLAPVLQLVALLEVLAG